jgi:hypothetical protein
MAKTVTFDVLAVAKGVGFDDLGNKIKRMADDSKVHVSNLVTAIAAVGPAAVPAGAVAVGALAGLAPVAGVAILALKGIEAQYKSGKLAGTQFGQSITSIKTEIRNLEQVAGSNVMAGLSNGLHSISSQFPMVNTLVATMSKQLGVIAGNVGAGLLALFTRLSPLFSTFGDLVVKASAGFAKWAQTSPSVTQFVGYVQKNLPQVEKILATVAVAVAHLVQGLAPLGGLSLGSIGVFAKLAAAIPVADLKVLAPLVAGITVATKAWTVAQAALNVALDANPIGIVVTALAALGAALVIAWNKTNTARMRIKGDLIDIGQTFVDAFTVIYDGFFRPIIHTFEGILGALGHLPGALGKPFRDAKNSLKGFDSAVQAMVGQANDHLSKLRAQLQTDQAKQRLNDLLKYIKDHSQQTINIDLQARTNYGKVPFAPNTGQNFYGGQYQGTHATGGMLGEGWNIVNEQGPEWMYKSGSQVQVYPHGTGGPRGGDTHITVNVHAPNLIGGPGTGHAIASELSRLIQGDVVGALRKAAAM